MYNQGYRCARCNKRITIRSSEADHVHPYSAGGSTDGSNAQMLCRTCHKKKTKSEHGVYYGKSKNPFGPSSSIDSIFGSTSSTKKKRSSKKKSDDWGFGF